ncbi:MAG TPA: MBOAT family protein, partial [Candidatus Binatia bacterium]
RNLLATMLLGGLWHGANWTFVVWGAIHGAALSAGRRFRRAIDAREADRPAWRVWLARGVTFHLVCLTWIFFRAPSLGDAMSFLAGLGAVAWRPEFFTAFFMLAFFTIPLFIVDLYLEGSREEYPLAASFEPCRVAVACGFLFAVMFFSASEISAFLYFQF